MFLFFFFVFFIHFLIFFLCSLVLVPRHLIFPPLPSSCVFLSSIISLFISTVLSSFLLVFFHLLLLSPLVYVIFLCFFFSSFSLLRPLPLTPTCLCSTSSSFVLFMPLFILSPLSSSTLCSIFLYRFCNHFILSRLSSLHISPSSTLHVSHTLNRARSIPPLPSFSLSLSSSTSSSSSSFPCSWYSSHFIIFLPWERESIRQLVAIMRASIV